MLCPFPPIAQHRSTMRNAVSSFVVVLLVLSSKLTPSCAIKSGRTASALVAAIDVRKRSFDVLICPRYHLTLNAASIDPALKDDSSHSKRELKSQKSKKAKSNSNNKTQRIKGKAKTENAPKTTTKKSKDKTETKTELKQQETDSSDSSATKTKIPACEIVETNPGVVAAFSQDLCNEWIPGSGQSSVCTASNSTHGGAVCSLAAQCTLQQFQDLNVGIVLLNSGTAQAHIKEGLLPYNRFVGTFPHDDRMFAVEINGEQLLTALEEGVEAAVSGEPGAYPCGAGIRFSVHLSASTGNRLYNVEVNPGLDNQWIPVDKSEMYFVATSEYLVRGGDGYRTFTFVEEVYPLGETFYDVFSECSVRNCPFSAIPLSEYSTQYFSR